MGTQINPSKALSVADLQEMITLLSTVKNAVKDHHGLTVSRINARTASGAPFQIRQHYGSYENGGRRWLGRGHYVHIV
jgi:hypothetical protein